MTARVVHRKGARTVRPTDRLRVTCWCEAKILVVDAGLVRDGLTVSCGRRDCRPRRAAS